MATTRPSHVDLLFINGPVLTLDPGVPQTANALAISGERIVAVGESGDLRSMADASTHVIDLEGRALVPGLTDAHFHLAYYGMTSSWLDLSSARNAREMTETVRAGVASRPTGTWVYGRGWDPAHLTDGRVPTLTELDEAAPVHALLLSRQDGHLCLANSEALRRAGIDGETTNPPGGRIERDASGAATGVLSEAALYLAWNVMMAEMTADDFREPLLRGCKAALSAGMTSVHAVLLENVAAELETLRALDEQGALPLRVYIIVPVESLGSLSRETVAWEGRRGRMGAAKIFTDGTLFAGTAALRAPYADAARSTGETTHSTNALRDLVQQTRDAGLQPAVHAVGDRAVEEVLDAFEAVYGTEESVKARPRIEHATVLAPDLIRRMRALGVVASLQPRRRAQLETRLGQARAAWVNPWRALVDVGVNVAASSDAPFLQNQPGSWAAVVDATRKGLTIEEALRVTAQGAAYASFQETELGVLRPGMLADVTVLAIDPRGRPPEELRDIRPVLVVIGGAVSWDASAR